MRRGGLTKIRVLKIIPPLRGLLKGTPSRSEFTTRRHSGVIAAYCCRGRIHAALPFRLHNAGRTICDPYTCIDLPTKGGVFYTLTCFTTAKKSVKAVREPPLLRTSVRSFRRIPPGALRLPAFPRKKYGAFAAQGLYFVIRRVEQKTTNSRDQSRASLRRYRRIRKPSSKPFPGRR